MKCKVSIAIDDAKRGRLAMLELAEIMTRLTAQILRAGVVLPITLTDRAGASVAELTIEEGESDTQP